jgi:hypothetical protein
LVALNARTGQQVWRRDGPMHELTPLPRSAAVVAADHGRAVAFGLSDGSVRWRSGPLCPVLKNYPGTPRVSNIRAADDSVFVGCAGGRLVRLDARTGETRVTLDALGYDGFNAITPLPHGTLAVAGWSSGAALRAYIALLRAADLHELVTPREETLLVGVVGDTAVLDDLCCFGRADVYRPATIVTVDLRDGKASEPLDLRPDPDRFPASRLGVGQGWNAAAIVGTHLLLGIVPMLYDYGDARAPAAAPQRLLSDLDKPPTYLADGSVFVRRRASDGTSVIELIDRRGAPIRLRARLETGGAPVLAYDERRAPGALALSYSSSAHTSPVFVRISDAAEISVPAGCRLLASTEEAAYASCTVRSDTLVGGYVAKFAFPPALAASPSPR